MLCSCWNFYSTFIFLSKFRFYQIMSRIGWAVLVGRLRVYTKKIDISHEKYKEMCRIYIRLGWSSKAKVLVIRRFGANGPFFYVDKFFSKIFSFFYRANLLLSYLLRFAEKCDVRMYDHLLALLLHWARSPPVSLPLCVRACVNFSQSTFNYKITNNYWGKCLCYGNDQANSKRYNLVP